MYFDSTNVKNRQLEMLDVFLRNYVLFSYIVLF